MRRAIRRFVSKLNGNNRIYFIALIVIICIISLAIGIYIQFFYAYYDTDPLMIGINVSERKTQEEYDALRQEFSNLFQNKLLTSNFEEENVSKTNEEQEVVYMAYNLANKDESFYSIDAKIPNININSDVIKSINSEIKSNYYDMANSIMRQSEKKIIYNVSYMSYINSDVLSLIIKSSLKEEDKNEKVSIKTYTYNITNDKLVTLDELISLKKSTTAEVQEIINEEIQKEYNNAKSISEEYGSLYERDLNNEMYKVENTKNYFLTNDGNVYIIYPYGNDNDTNEIDIVIF